MIVLYVLFAIYWLGLLVSLFFGFEPTKVIVGCGFLISGLSFVSYAIDAWAKKCR